MHRAGESPADFEKYRRACPGFDGVTKRKSARLGRSKGQVKNRPRIAANDNSYVPTAMAA